MAKVFVGLSGGVDSAVSAALLKEQGHTVVGCFIKIWQPEFIECTWREDRLDAMRICACLKIPFREIDLSDEYKSEIINDMINCYIRGFTPNPDVLCNTKIKFGSFTRWAYSQGAHYVATGHYARTEKRSSDNVLLRGRDRNKDQSYFLWQLTSSDLQRIMFPVGEFTKERVRNEAVRRNIPVARKHDSQGLCFVGDITLPEFLSRYITLKKGLVYDEEGTCIGNHDGAALYTVGQRHGFTHLRSTEPLYVVRTDVKNNTLTVSHDKRRAASNKVTLRDVQWVRAEPKIPGNFFAQTRYREAPVNVHLTKGNATQVEFETPHIAAPGQSLVVYRDDEVVGGGVIEGTV